MLKRTFFALTILALLLVAITPTLAQDEELPVVGIFQFVSHPALDAGRDGAVAALEAAGYIDGENVRLVFGNGEGDIPTLSLIAEDFIDEGAEVIIAVSTPALQAAYNATLDLEEPVVIFNTVTSPYAAGVADASCVHPSWVTGSQALAPYGDIVPLVFDLVPEAETIGLIYNDAEANSVASKDVVLEIAAELGLAVEEQTVANSSEVPTAAEALVTREIDAFLVITDSTVVAALEGLVQVANDNAIPVIGSDPASGERGAVLARGLDYFQEGLDTGSIAAAYLAGELEDLSMVRIQPQQQTLLSVNLDAADAQGVEVPESLLEEAAVIIEGGEVTEVEAMVEMDMDSIMEYVESLTCTQEEIDEQMAELEMSEE